MPANKESDFKYHLGKTADEICIVAYKGSRDIVVIPDKIDGKPVTEVGGVVFAISSEVRAVFFPESVAYLTGAGVFVNNQVIEIVIAEGVKELSDGTFSNCSVKQILLGDKVEKLGLLSIGYCASLEKLVVLSDPVIVNMETSKAFLMACPNLTITGLSGSKLEQYAKEKGIPFIAK